MSASTDPTGFDELDDYLTFLRSRGRKETTLYNLRATLRRILTDLRDNGRHWHVGDIDDNDIVWMEAFYYDRSEGTRCLYERSLSRMVYHYTGKDPAKQSGLLHNDDTGCGNVHFITTEQFAELYKVGDPTDRMILVLGAFMGLRRAEMANVRESDIVGDRMTVRGKGHGINGKVVVMEIPDRVMDEIESYHRYKEQYPKGCAGLNLIEIPRGRGRLEPSSVSTIGRRMNALKHETGIDFSTHSLRRLFATTLYYEVEDDLVTIKNLMRHCKSETTVTRYIAPLKVKERKMSDGLSKVYEKALGEI